MSVCEELSKALAERIPNPSDAAICAKYEAANELFENLVNQGIAEKRGYQLLPIENRICLNAKINC